MTQVFMNLIETSRTTNLILFLFTIGLLTTSCTSLAPTSSAPGVTPNETEIPGPTVPASTPVIPVLSLTDSDIGPQALTSGPIIVEGRCLYIGIDRTFPVFPHGTAHWEDGALVYLGERYEVGDMLKLGGGYGTYQSTIEQFSEPPDPSCIDDEFWMVAPE